MNKIVFDTPCPESWDGMTEKENGRFCDKCCKIVHDFTSKTKEEILDILHSLGRKKVCIRVSAEVASPVPVFNRPVKRNRLFLYALILAFGGLLFTSCRSHKPTHLQGDVKIFDWAPKTPSVHPDPEVFPKK